MDQAANRAAIAKVKKKEGSIIANKHSFIPFAFDTSEWTELLRKMHRVINNNVILDLLFKEACSTTCSALVIYVYNIEALSKQCKYLYRLSLDLCILGSTQRNVS